MTDGNSTIRIEFAELISATDSDKILASASAIIEKLTPEDRHETLQKIAFPTSSDQPEGYPFVVVQDGNVTQMSVTRRGITLIQNHEARSPEDYSSNAINMVSALLGGSEAIISKDELRLLEVEFVAFLRKESYSNIIDSLKQYFDTSIDINSAGFSFSYNLDSEYPWLTRRRVGYGSGLNLSEGQIALQVSEALVLGGFDFNTLSYSKITREQTNAFVESFNEEVINTTLSKYYGKKDQ